MASGVRVEGLNKTVKALQQVGVEIADLKETFSGIAAQGARLASSFAPSRSGLLRATIRGNKAKNKAVVLAGGARTPYAGAINYGWKARGIEPALFMQKADRELAGSVPGLLEDGLNAAIRKAGLE